MVTLFFNKNIGKLSFGKPQYFEIPQLATKEIRCIDKEVELERPGRKRDLLVTVDLNMVLKLWYL